MKTNESCGVAPSFTFYDEHFCFYLPFGIILPALGNAKCDKLEIDVTLTAHPLGFCIQKIRPTAEFVLSQTRDEKTLNESQRVFHSP